MAQDILFLLWFALPAMLANIIPIPLAKIPWLKKYDAPMDFGKTWHGERLLGANKTWRGFFGALVMATAVLWLQKLAFEHFAWAQSISGSVDYTGLPVLVLGPLFAIGVIGGDAVESFFKRRRGIPPGRTWFPWDQVDSVIGTMIAVAPFVVLSLQQYVLALLLLPLVHLLMTYLGWLVGLKERPV